MKALARRRKVPMAQLIRQGVDDVLADATADEDPLLDIVGMFDSGIGDLAEHHDEHLAAVLATHQP